MDSREAFVALNLIDHVGPVRVRQLLDRFGAAPAILGAPNLIASTAVAMLA